MKRETKPKIPCKIFWVSDEWTFDHSNLSKLSLSAILALCQFPFISNDDTSFVISLVVAINISIHIYIVFACACAYACVFILYVLCACVRVCACLLLLLFFVSLPLPLPLPPCVLSLFYFICWTLMLGINMNTMRIWIYFNI